jgi:hypothetical protein
MAAVMSKPTRKEHEKVKYVYVPGNVGTVLDYFTCCWPVI